MCLKCFSVMLLPKKALGPKNWLCFSLHARVLQNSLRLLFIFEIPHSYFFPGKWLVFQLTFNKYLYFFVIFFYLNHRALDVLLWVKGTSRSLVSCLEIYSKCMSCEENPEVQKRKRKTVVQFDLVRRKWGRTIHLSMLHIFWSKIIGLNT